MFKGVGPVTACYEAASRCGHTTSSQRPKVPHHAAFSDALHLTIDHSAHVFCSHLYMALTISSLSVVSTPEKGPHSSANSPSSCGALRGRRVRGLEDTSQPIMPRLCVFLLPYCLQACKAV